MRTTQCTLAGHSYPVSISRTQRTASGETLIAIHQPMIGAAYTTDQALQLAGALLFEVAPAVEPPSDGVPSPREPQPVDRVDIRTLDGMRVRLESDTTEDGLPMIGLYLVDADGHVAESAWLSITQAARLRDLLGMLEYDR